MSASSALTTAALRRYSRQILLPEIGVAGQRKLAAAKVLIIGAGGLGSPVALYLAAAGVGTLGIADLDAVEEHNLHRQLLHGDADVGQPKVTSATDRLRALNPQIEVRPHPGGITAQNAVGLFEEYDIVVDGTDNFAARYLNNDAAFFARRPLVHGSIFKFEGQVSIFDPATGGPCYRCLFPIPPAPGSVPACGEAGVLGPLCGVIGSIQAMEVIKLITGCSTPLRGRLLTYHALDHTTQTLTVPRNPDCPLCGKHPSLTSIDAGSHDPTCISTASPPTAPMNESDFPLEISVQTARDLLARDADRTLLLDVREPFELEICRIGNAHHVPMRRIPEALAELPRDRHLLVLCHHGGRSRRVMEYLRDHGFAAVSNISGGINAWAEEIDPSLARY